MSYREIRPATRQSLPAIGPVGWGIAIGGYSHMVDLIARGAAVDFVRIGRRPNSNLSDVALCAGSGLTAIGLT